MARTEASRRFQPTFWFTVFCGGALLVLIALGTWQVQRLGWKQDLIDTRTERLAAPPILDAAGIDPAEHAFRRTVVEGVFLHDKEMFLAARSLKRRLGHHVVTPMRRADGSTVLVNRGWVPRDNKEPSTRLEGQVAGTVSVAGVVRGSGRRNWLSPENDPATNTWFLIDIPAMAAYAGLERVLPFVVEAGPAENPGGLPIGGQTKSTLPNDHLQYAITWFSLALALIVIYIVYSTRRPDDGEQGPE